MSRYNFSSETSNLHPGIGFTQKNVQSSTLGCYTCQEEIGSGQVFETKEKEVSKIASRQYHSRCFRCADCGLDFKGGVFHNLNGKLLCSKDFFERKGFNCSMCDRVGLDRYVDAEGRRMCEDCFQCKTCKRGFNDGKHFFYQGSFYCEAHAAAAQGQTCGGCGQGVPSGISALGQTWHRECWKCAGCSKPLGNSFVEQDGRGFHQDCVHLPPVQVPRSNSGSRDASGPSVWEAMGGTPCAECGSDVGAGEGKEVDGRKYHSSCLKCHSCRKTLSGSFSVEGRKFYCSNCSKPATQSASAGDGCYTCGKKLVGSVAKVGEKEYHADCLGCSKCGTKFPDGRFYLVDGEPRCEDHA